MFKNKTEHSKIEIFINRLKRQYKESNFPMSGINIHRDSYIEKHVKINNDIIKVLDKIRNKEPINVMLFGKDMLKKYDIACYIFNIYFSYNCRKRCIDHNNYDHKMEARWIESRGWLSNFNRIPTSDDARKIKFMVFFDFFPVPQNIEHIRMFQSLLVFRPFNNISTIFDAGTNFKQLFNTQTQGFDDTYAGTILKKYDKIEV